MSLLIALPGPELPESEDATALRHALPGLPVLSALLARARCLPVAADWRAGVVAALCGSAGCERIPAAAIAARAVPAIAAGTALCFAEALHVVPGISRVHLPPGGRLRLQAAEAQAWSDAFNREFGGPDLHLHAASGGWLLAAPFAHGARDAAPETLVGQPLARAAAGDAAQRALRRLGAEAEMWLAAHPLNQQREARQLQPLNNLWFWGGAHAVELPPFARAPAAMCVAGEADAWLAGIAAHCALLPRQVVGWQALTAAGGATLLVLPPPPEGASGQYWQMLEATWFEPAAQALRERRLDALHLQIGATAWRLPERSLLRWFRRRRPWHELVSA
jgi:hypothetical protein